MMLKDEERPTLSWKQHHDMYIWAPSRYCWHIVRMQTGMARFIATPDEVHPIEATSRSSLLLQNSAYIDAP